MKIVVLDNIRSALNIGSIFRTGSGIGINKIYICGISPIPFETSEKLKDKNIKRKDFVKTSLGAEDEIEWEYKENILDLLKDLKKENYEIVALEQNEKSIDYKDLKIEKEKVAIILGSETEGVQEKVIDLCDKIAEIPMLGLKESLNVTIAFAILAYKIWDN